MLECIEYEPCPTRKRLELNIPLPFRATTGSLIVSKVFQVLEISKVESNLKSLCMILETCQHVGGTHKRFNQHSFLV